ncbi:MAG: methyltransferase domain-containing protein [Armatimonadetes bacterium]|nr:methyltransferase domain-containing protein [Armatimonadota bacterium]
MMMTRLLAALTVANLVVAAWTFAAAPRPSPIAAAARDDRPVTYDRSSGIAFVLGGVLYNNNDPVLRKDREMFASILEVKPGDVVADIGCCTGFHVFHLASLVGPQGKVYAVDVDAQAVKYVQRRAAALGLNHVETRVSRPLDPLLPKGRLDGVLFINVYHCIVEQKDLGNEKLVTEKVKPLLENIAASLAPGGRLLVFDFPEYREDVRRACARSGLREVPYQGPHAGEITLWEATRSGTR